MEVDRKEGQKGVGVTGRTSNRALGRTTREVVGGHQPEAQCQYFMRIQSIFKWNMLALSHNKQNENPKGMVSTERDGMPVKGKEEWTGHLPNNRTWVTWN